MRIFRVAAILIVALFAIPISADAHPLGNFTSNHLTRIEVGPASIDVHYVLDDAETLLEAVLKIAPGYRAARYDYACVLLERHLYQRACEEAENLLVIEPDHLDYRALYASASVGLGEHDRAIALYQKLLQEVPAAADLHLSLAHSLKTQGRQAESIAAPTCRRQRKPASVSAQDCQVYRQHRPGARGNAFMVWTQESNDSVA